MHWFVQAPWLVAYAYGRVKKLTNQEGLQVPGSAWWTQRRYDVRHQTSPSRSQWGECRYISLACIAASVQARHPVGNLYLFIYLFIYWCKNIWYNAHETTSQMDNKAQAKALTVAQQ